MSTTVCRLCCRQPAIENSHVIPRFVFRAIKSDSPTGFFRNPNCPNQRHQDGDKLPLLCRECEQRFGSPEREFTSNIFLPFHEHDRDDFSYGEWLHYFMTSLAWRTLILDLPGLQADPANPRAVVTGLAEAAETMRQYLLGASSLAASLRNHAVVFTKASSASRELAGVGPNVKVRRSTFGYTVLDRHRGYSAVMHNLAGFMCFLVVKGNPRDTWSGTKVVPSGGTIRQPQRVSSWLIAELLNNFVDMAHKQNSMSERQQEKIRAAMRQNMSAAGRRFEELDERLIQTS